MKRTILMILVVCSFCLVFAAPTKKLVRISIAEHDEVYTLAKYKLTIVDAGKDYVKALIDNEMMDELRAAGYQMAVVIDDYKAYKDEIFLRGFYHTYSQVYSVLDSFADNYPSICRLDTIGFSIQGRAIWAMRVTDNPQIEESEPEIRLAGNIHGDEHIGTEITLYFLRHILTNYNSNVEVQNLVNNQEIWVLPVLNPDGNVYNQRENLNNVDLNRDYGYFWDGWGGSPGPCSQIENKVIVQHLQDNNISLEYNYHSWAYYVNYPWDYHYADPPDSGHIISLSQIYANLSSLEAINGYDWYQVNGSMQDYTIGISGGLAWTIETSEPGSSSAIDQVCYENRDALMEICPRAGWGIVGVVKDSLTNLPLYARIEIVSPERIDIYTDPILGDFHKMIQQGNYDLKISANGYAPKTVSNVSVPSSGSVALGNIELIPDSTYLYAFGIVLCRYRNHAEQNNRTQPRFTLGAPDSRFFSLGAAGYVVLDMGSNTLITDLVGNDFTIYEGNDGTAEGYTAYVANDWEGPWTFCGNGTGTTSFDLLTSGLSQARYLRVVDDGTSSSGQYAGFDLDAIEFYAAAGINENQNPDVGLGTAKITLSPNPFRDKVEINFQAPNPKSQISSKLQTTLAIYDACGRQVKHISLLTSNFLLPTSIIWDGTDDSGQKLAPGVYFVHLESEGFKAATKAILLR